MLHRMPRPLFATLLLALLMAGVAFAQQGLIVLDSVVMGHENNTDELTCVQASHFQHEQQVVWRVKVIDPATSEPMSDADLDSVVITLPDGETFDMAYGGHPHDDPLDSYWTANWVIPADYPSGTVDYTITATAADGRTGDLITFPIPASILTILPD